MKPWRVVKAVEKVVKGKGRLKIYLERRGDGYRVQLWRQGTISLARMKSPPTSISSCAAK